MHFFAKIVCICEKKAVILHRFLEKERGHIEISVLWRTDLVSWNFTTSQSTIRSGQHKRLTELIAFVGYVYPAVVRGVFV